MVTAFLCWKLCALLLRYEIAEGGLPAFKFSGFVIDVNPACNLSFSSLQESKLVHELCEFGYN